MTLDRLPARTQSGAFHVVVESPARSAVKIKFDPAFGAFRYSRPLLAGRTYPGGVGDVDGELQRPAHEPLDLIAGGLEARSAPSHQRHVCPGSGESPRGRAPHPGRRSRDRNDLATPHVDLVGRP